MSMRLRDLRGLDASDDPGMAVITGTAADGTVTIDIGGASVPAFVDAAYTPVLHDVVRVSRRGGTWWVEGTRRTSNTTTQTLSMSWPTPYRVLPAVIAVPNPLIITAVETRSWRSTDGWSRPQVYQGRFETSTGYWHGCVFYGPDPAAAIKGRTCTYIRWRDDRYNAGGVIGAQAQYVAPHAHPTRPAGAPVWTAAAQRITSALTLAGVATDGDLARDETKRLILPTAWGQGIIDGTIAGFGLLLLATGNGNYSISYDLATRPLMGQIEIGWA